MSELIEKATNENVLESEDSSSEEEDENLSEENRDIKWVPTIDDFKDKFLSKMRQLADKHKTDKVKYYTVEHDDMWKVYDDAEILFHTLFVAFNIYDFWLKLHKTENMYNMYFQLDDGINEMDYANLLLKLGKEKLSTMDEDARMEFLVKQDIDNFNKFYNLSSEDCSDCMWFIEMTNIV